MYTLSELDDLLEKASYILSVYAKGEIFPDAANKEIFQRLVSLSKAVGYEQYRVGVTEYNDIAEELYSVLENFDYLYPVPTAVADFYPIDGNRAIRYVTGISDSIISNFYTWSSTKIYEILGDSTYHKTKIPITVAGTKTIQWQTDVAPGSDRAYAVKHSNIGFVATGFYEDGELERSYNPGIIITRSAGNIITVDFTDVFVGYIIIS